MNFDINEARAIIEAAKKRGAIREQGDDRPRPSAPQPSEKPPIPAILPEWLKTEIEAPSSSNKVISPEWRGA